MSKWICVVSGLLTLSAAPALAVIWNGFDSDRIYVLNGGANDPTDLLLSHSKLTGISLADNWTEVGIPQNTATSGTFFGHQFIGLTFSSSPTAGANTPAGYRLFYLGRERAPDFDTYRPILVEVDSNCNELREAYIGRIVCGDKNFGGYNVQNWPRSNLRYNAKNNTLMVGISHDGVGTGAILHGYIYEFTLPDSPVGTGVGSPDELQGITLMETYDTGIIGTNANEGFNINVAPDGTVYFRNQYTDLYSFSTAGGSSPGGTTSNPTLVVTNATLNTAAGTTLGQWQSAIYRPVSNSLINLQRKTGGADPKPVMVDYSLTTHIATLIPNSTGIRGQHNGSLDVATGDVWIASQSYPSAQGSAWKYTADTPGVLIHWDTLEANDGGRLLFDIAVPPAGLGACCKPTSAGGGCEVMSQQACTEIGGAWQGPGTVCGPSSCPTGACCGGCGQCEQLQQADCTGRRVWMGANTVCGQGPCPTSLCPEPYADADCDGDVDQEDFGVFQACLFAPASSQDCTCQDKLNVGETEGTVDDVDLQVFVACITGPAIPFNLASPPAGCNP